ncbi:Thioesterase superfamily protein [Caldanaerobius fijiensis DSM 17918]|uniref:Thioesterase superfamily protein n=1 Tax=Caldanaerobius fijiensis DSM 17918 TaxID=1121256 RepID=A0A1M5EJ00_9THEO|nr:Thioesterase superfamily protein [Caldanaerobius fijiensis DSM 17918]
MQNQSYDEVKFVEIKNDGLDRAVFDKIVWINNKMNFQNHVGVEVKEVGKGYAILQLKFNEEHANTIGIAHGGVTATLLDAAMGTAAFTTGKDVVTLEMKVNFLAPGKIGSVATAEGRVLHYGNKTIVTEGKIFDENGGLMALATGTYFVMK